MNIIRKTCLARASSAMKKEGISIAGIKTSRLTLSILGTVFNSLKFILRSLPTFKSKPKPLK
jgi:hypothetical protein